MRPATGTATPPLTAAATATAMYFTNHLVIGGLRLPYKYMIKYMAVAVDVAVSGGVAVPVAVPVAGLTKRFFIKKNS